MKTCADRLASPAEPCKLVADGSWYMAWFKARAWRNGVPMPRKLSEDASLQRAGSGVGEMRTPNAQSDRRAYRSPGCGSLD